MRKYKKSSVRIDFLPSDQAIIRFRSTNL